MSVAISGKIDIFALWTDFLMKMNGGRQFDIFGTVAIL
jgi:hypothetical protein